MHRVHRPLALLILGAALVRKIGRSTLPAVRRLQTARDSRAALVLEYCRHARLCKLESRAEAWRVSLTAARGQELGHLLTKRYRDALMAALQLGPVAISVSASWSAYESGIFDDVEACGTTIDHGVVAVGYGTEKGQDCEFRGTL